MPSSRVHFDVHGGLPELQAYARERGWAAKGWTMTFPWQELRFTTDGWRTMRVVKSTEVPSPLTNGFFTVPVAKGTKVEFALHVGLASHAPGDAAGYREAGELWLNNGGHNYAQVTQ